MSAFPELKPLLLGPPPLRLGVAESLTSGRVQARVGEISGASHFFRGGITAYGLDEKVRLLGVDREEAQRSNCVSVQVAEQMAVGACALFDVDLGLATTGYAEPANEHGVLQPFAWWALAHRSSDGRSFLQVQSGRIECWGATRLETQITVADAVLKALVEHLRAYRG